MFVINLEYLFFLEEVEVVKIIIGGEIWIVNLFFLGDEIV